MMTKELAIRARDALLSACAGRCNAEYNPCEAREVADALTAYIDAPEPEPDAYLVYDKGSLSQYACLDDDLGDMDDCEVRSLYANPPAVREPLSDAEIHEWWARDNGLEDVDMCKLADFTQVIRAIEAAHGIKS